MQAVSTRDRKLYSACRLRGVSMQLLWCSFDCQASISFWWSAGEWDGRCHTRTKDDICNVRAITVPLTDVFLIPFSSRFTVQLWLSSSLGLVVVSSVSPVLVHILIVVAPTDTLVCAIGKRANALHVNAYFSAQWALFSAIGYVPRLGLFPY